MTQKVASFAEIEDEFDAYIGRTVYATMVTVDKRNRPRTRILIPIWETVAGRPLGGWRPTARRSRRHTSRTIRT